MEHDIAAQVLAAREDPQAADELVRQYLPFIRSETAKAIGRPPVEGVDDELGIAMFAFHQAALAYDSSRGAFLPLAAAAIRNRIIDYRRKERRHEGVLSLDQRLDDGDSRTLLDQLDAGRDELAERQVRQEAREEDRRVRRAAGGVRPEIDGCGGGLPPAGPDPGGLLPGAGLRQGPSGAAGAAAGHPAPSAECAGGGQWRGAKDLGAASKIPGGHPAGLYQWL